MTTPTQEVLQPAEAGFSTNLYLNHEKFGRLQFTFRGATSRDWGNVLEDVDRFMGYMTGKGWSTDTTRQPENRTGAESEKKAYEPAPVSASDLPEGLPEGIECFKEDFDEIEITPQADDKATVTFYRDGMKFPVGAKINKWKCQNVVQALAPLGEFDVTKAQKVRTAGTQYYSKGSEYIIAQGAHKGEKSHYKDFRLAVSRF